MRLSPRAPVVPELGSPGPPYSVAPTTRPVPGGPRVIDAAEPSALEHPARPEKTEISSASSAAPRPAAAIPAIVAPATSAPARARRARAGRRVAMRPPWQELGPAAQKDTHLLQSAVSLPAGLGSPRQARATCPPR